MLKKDSLFVTNIYASFITKSAKLLFCNSTLKLNFNQIIHYTSKDSSSLAKKSNYFFFDYRSLISVTNKKQLIVLIVPKRSHCRCSVIYICLFHYQAHRQCVCSRHKSCTSFKLSR